MSELAELDEQIRDLQAELKELRRKRRELVEEQIRLADTRHSSNEEFMEAMLVRDILMREEAGRIGYTKTGIRWGLRGYTVRARVARFERQVKSSAVHTSPALVNFSLRLAKSEGKKLKPSEAIEMFKKFDIPYPEDFGR